MSCINLIKAVKKKKMDVFYDYLFTNGLLTDVDVFTEIFYILNAVGSILRTFYRYITKHMVVILNI